MSALVEGTAAGVSYLAGEGWGARPIVLLHGIGSNARSFAPLMQALEGRAPTLAWNAPGYAASQPLTIEWPDASDYAAALQRLLDELGIRRCVLLGHSLGCLMAARYAATKPEQVAVLFLVSPALGNAAQKGAPLPPPVAKRIEELDRLGPAQFAAARAGGLLADPSARPDVLQAVREAMAAVRRPGYDHAARLLAVGRLLDDAAKLAVPTTVLVGEQDRITPPEKVRRAFDAVPVAQRRLYREIPDAGHAICQERPDVVARVIAEIVADEAKAHA